VRKISEIGYRKILRIASSQYYSIKKCPYKYLLAAAFDNKTLLPLSPNAYLGTVFHKILEKISKHEIKTEGDFEFGFYNEIAKMESKLQSQGFGYYVPLQLHTQDFGIKKLLLKKRLESLQSPSKGISGCNFYSEKWVESKNGKVVGVIDLVIEKDTYIELIEFKTGQVKQEAIDDPTDTKSNLKKEYVAQLKLYAYLFVEHTGKTPNKLSIVDLKGDKRNVEIKISECKEICDDAQKLLLDMNNSIQQGVFSGDPTIEKCQYCLYRPACLFYDKKGLNKFAVNDIWGIVTNVIKHKNGNITLHLNADHKDVAVLGYAMNKYEEFETRKGKKIKIYNLKKAMNESIYSITKTSTVYE
jgi:CRISPR/Cas system-associated exonuclease Cas4 (RecB family)